MKGRDKVGCAKGDDCVCRSPEQWEKCLEPLRWQLKERNDKIALQIEVQASLPSEQGGGRGVVFRTFIDRDCSPADLDTLMDKLRVSIDRQHAFAEVERWSGAQQDAERIAAEHAARLEVVQENVQRKWVTDNRRGEVKLTASEEKELQGSHANVEHSKKSIEFAKKKVEYYKQRINGHAVT